MKCVKAVVLRVTGIVVFMLVLSAFLEMISRAVSSFAFFVSSPQLGWGLYYIFTSILFATFFFFALFSSFFSAIFAGKSEYISAQWNSALLALFCVSLFATLTQLTGIEEGDAAIMMLAEAAVFLLIFYALIMFFCLKKENGFRWNDIFKKDKYFFMCIKVYLIMLAVLETASFLYAHKILE